MLSKVKLSKNLNKASLPLGCLRNFGGGRRLKKNRNKFGEKINFYTFTEQLSKNLIFVFSGFSRGFFITHTNYASTFKKFQSSTSNFQKPRSKERNQKNQKRIITCGLDENYYPFNFYVDLCFQREKISHRAR